MSKMSNVSDNSFTPFQSGCSKCYPSTDYYSVKTGGSDGNYSNDGLIPKSNGENLYVEQEFNKQMDSNFIKKNYGIDYKTANGGKKSKKGGSYNIDSEENHNVIPGIGGSKKSMKGGMESSGATPLPQRFFNPTLELNNSQKISGTGTMSAYGQIDSEDIGTGMLAPYGSSSFAMKTGGKKSAKPSKLIKKKISKTSKLSKDKKKIKGGYSLVNTEDSMNALFNYDKYFKINSEELLKNNSLSGGKKSIKKGGSSNMDSEESSLSGGKKSIKKGGSSNMDSEESSLSGGKKSIKKGGVAPFIVSSEELSLMGGKKSIKKGGVAPFIVSSEESSLMGGKKSIKKGGSSIMVTDESSLMGGKKLIKKGGVAPFIVSSEESSLMGGKKSIKKGGSSIMVTDESSLMGGKKIIKKGVKKTIKKSTKKITKSKKSMKGGMESSGATPMTQSFYDPTIPVDNYNELSGNDVMSAYGPIESGDIGTGMLAPYNASTCSTVNPNSTMKTGGKKLVKKIGGASGLIPKISDKPISTVQKTINGAISGFSNFINKLDQDYLKSVSYVKTVKIGNQRLIQGGKKDKKKVQKKKIIKKGGSNGSDFALTLNSRGPVNAPDDFWGVPGEKWFKQFNKTGEYIPNSKLAYAATPLLAGIGNSPEVTAYDSLGTDYGSV